MATYNGYVLTDKGRVLVQTGTDEAAFELWLPAASEFDAHYATIYVCKGRPSEENAGVARPASWAPIPADHPEVDRQLTEFQRTRAGLAIRDNKEWLAAHPAS